MQQHHDDDDDEKEAMKCIFCVEKKEYKLLCLFFSFSFSANAVVGAVICEQHQKHEAKREMEERNVEGERKYCGYIK